MYIITGDIEKGAKLEKIINIDLGSTTTLNVKYNYFSKRFDLFFRNNKISEIDNYIFKAEKNRKKALKIIF